MSLVGIGLVRQNQNLQFLCFTNSNSFCSQGIYDVVDESEYRKIVRGRREDDFIGAQTHPAPLIQWKACLLKFDFIFTHPAHAVDDGGADYDEYKDEGGEIWDEEDAHFSRLINHTTTGPLS